MADEESEEREESEESKERREADRRGKDRRKGDRREQERRSKLDEEGRKRNLEQVRDTISAWEALQADREQDEEERKRGRIFRRRD